MFHSHTGGITSCFPFHYGLLNARGFVSPYVLKDGRCTFCSENPLTNLTPDWIIDHIYITTDTFERVIVSEVYLPSNSLHSFSSGLKHYVLFFLPSFSSPYSDSLTLSSPLSMFRYLTTTESCFVSPTSERNVTPGNNVATFVSRRYKSCFLSN